MVRAKRHLVRPRRHDLRQPRRSYGHAGGARGRDVRGRRGRRRHAARQREALAHLPHRCAEAGSMRASHTLLLALMSVSLLACDKPATEEDRKRLTGLWIPDDGSRHTIEFKKDGVFDFVYDAIPPRTVLRIKWSLDSKGKVDIRGHDRSR